MRLTNSKTTLSQTADNIICLVCWLLLPWATVGIRLKNNRKATFPTITKTTKESINGHYQIMDRNKNKIMVGQVNEMRRGKSLVAPGMRPSMKSSSGAKSISWLRSTGWETLIMIPSITICQMIHLLDRIRTNFLKVVVPTLASRKWLKRPKAVITIQRTIQ